MSSGLYDSGYVGTSAFLGHPPFMMSFPKPPMSAGISINLDDTKYDFPNQLASHDVLVGDCPDNRANPADLKRVY